MMPLPMDNTMKTNPHLENYDWAILQSKTTADELSAATVAFFQAGRRDLDAPSYKRYVRAKADYCAARENEKTVGRAWWLFEERR